MKLLVTGGAGFIGSCFVRRRLAATDDTIVVIDKLTYAGNRENLASCDANPDLAPRFVFVRADICDEEVVGKLIQNADAVVNFAANHTSTARSSTPRRSCGPALLASTCCSKRSAGNRTSDRSGSSRSRPTRSTATWLRA